MHPPEKVYAHTSYATTKSAIGNKYRAEFLHIPTSPENLPSTPLQLLQRDGTLQKKPAQQSFPPEGVSSPGLPPPPRALSFQSMPGETASTCKKGARRHLGIGVLRRHRITGGKHRINWISMTEPDIRIATSVSCTRGPSLQYFVNANTTLLSPMIIFSRNDIGTENRYL
ncbi:uncharacterized protein VK521_004058 [Ammospiza maritima maritima]